MSGADKAVETLLAEARADFGARLESKLAELEALAVGGAWTEARRAAHRLRGSAATYGFGKIGDAAAAMEDVLIDAKTSPDDEAKKRFASALAAARREALAAATERP